MGTVKHRAKIRQRKPIRRSPARKDPLMRRFASTVSKEELGGMLAHSGDERAWRLLEILMDPVYGNHSFAVLCGKVGLNQIDVVDLFRRYKLDLGVIKMSRLAPQVMQDMAEDARSRMETCKGCQGSGMVNTRRCPQCEGDGRVRVPGDDKARRLFFKVMLTRKGPR